MKVRLLVLALLLTVLALAPEPPAWAFTCPPNNCFDVTQDCVDSGGAPIPQGTGQTCSGPPDGDEYDVNFVLCFYPSTGIYTQRVCYQ